MIAPNRDPSISQTETVNVYDREFWLLYVANVAFVTANALTFRFAELVKHLGGTEQLTGTIVSVGLIAALVVRFRLGQEIDHYGTRKLWTASSLLFLAGCCLFLMANRLGWQMYAARIAFAVGVAASFTCSVVYLQNRVPAHRSAELVGTLGSGGFVGMIVGALLGDWILKALPAGTIRFHALFGVAAGLGVLYLILVESLSRHDVHQRPAHTPPVHRLVVRYWPGNVVLVAMMIGVGLAVTTVFLTRFATERGLNGIGTFFAGYSISAFFFRVWARHWSQTMGRHRMIYLGLCGHCLGHFLLPQVTSHWHFLVPSVACGFGHALLFPAVVTLGPQSFPSEYRGTGTTVVLGFVDVGVLLSAPVLGRIIDHFQFAPMFYASGTTALLIGIVYALTDGRRPDDEMTSESQRSKETTQVASASADGGDSADSETAAPEALRADTTR